MLEPITLPCASTITGDQLDVTYGEYTGCVELYVSVGGKTATHMLDKDSARALFNWLGVWLHTQ